MADAYGIIGREGRLRMEVWRNSRGWQVAISRSWPGADAITLAVEPTPDLALSQARAVLDAMFDELAEIVGQAS